MTTLNRRLVAGLIAGVLLRPIAFAVPSEAPWLEPEDVSLLDLLPPPPDSHSTEVEIAAFHNFERTRTGDQVKHAIADNEATVFRFLAGMGINLDPSVVPHTAHFFERIAATEYAFVGPAQKAWARKRPPWIDPTIKPLIKLSNTGSYPSGHATLGILFAIMLAKMVPEKKDELFARSFDYGYSRYVVGVHYLSDIEAAKLAGAAIGNALLHKESVLKAMVTVKVELRSALKI